jgi:hypothetical protein
LVLEVVGHEGAGVVVAEREAAGGVGAEVAELLAEGHAERLTGPIAASGDGSRVASKRVTTLVTC